MEQIFATSIFKIVVVVIALITLSFIILARYRDEDEARGAGQFIVVVIVGAFAFLNVASFVACVFILGVIFYAMCKAFKRAKAKYRIREKEEIFSRESKKINQTDDFREYHRLAELYEKGIGTEMSWKQAAIYYRKAAELGDANEKREFGKHFEKGDHIAREVDLEEAQRWYDAADKWERENRS
jgi:predicted membrane protein